MRDIAFKSTIFQFLHHSPKKNSPKILRLKYALSEHLKPVVIDEFCKI